MFGHREAFNNKKRRKYSKYESISRVLNQVWELQTRSLEVVVTYYLTSAPFPLSSGVDHTPFQSFINPRTKQSHGVLNDNPMVPNNPEYVQCWRGVTTGKALLVSFVSIFIFLSIIFFFIFSSSGHTPTKACLYCICQLSFMPC